MADDFSLENLPYGSIRLPDAPGEPPRLCVALGGDAIELAAISDRLPGIERELIDAPNLDRLLRADAATWNRLSDALTEALSEPAPDPARTPLLAQAIPCLPFTVGDYVDFFSSLEHATNASRIFRPDAADPLPPNWRHMPVAYHGRASTVVVSGTPIRRPLGQRAESGGPTFGPSRGLDIEVELGFVTGGPANALGEPVSIERAAERIFGFVLVNDWSARDIQAWESRPLGPFLGKSFATSISPWVVPLRALESRRVPSPPQDPPPLPYLRTDADWGLDIELTATLESKGGAPHTIITTNARDLYWTAPQQLAHAASGGAIVRPGDLFASGTISGEAAGSQGCLLELTWNGARPLKLGDGTTRTFLEDGDVVRISAAGFGELSGEILPQK